MKQLDPRAVWLFSINYLLGMSFVFILIGILVSSIFNGSYFLERLLVQTGNNLFVSLLAFTIQNWILSYLVFGGLGLAWTKLYYDSYKYELTKDGFKKESGVIWKQYVTIPYERIQNVDIFRGPMARMFGISDLQIQTAGMSAIVGRYGAAGVGAEGRLPGVSKEEAETLRDELIKRAKRNGSGV